MQIIDAHHHLWNLEKHDHPWLKPDAAHPAGDLTPICRNYQLDDFLTDARQQSLVKSVHLQAGISLPESVEETAWLQTIADDPASGGFPHAIVAFADFPDPMVEAVLERQAAHRNLRGIRYILNYEPGEPLYCAAERGDWLTDPDWRRGYALLAKYDLSFDLQIFWHQMGDALDLARAFPEIQMILNHTGMPRKCDADYVAHWRQAMRQLAEAPNVATKISGLGMYYPDWTAEVIRPFVIDTIDVFGIDRCMFASNFPVDKLSSGYDQIWQAFDQLTADFGAEERQKLFHDNAARFYRL